MCCLELYEIVYERNPLRRLCGMMVCGRMEIPWYYTSVTLYFARTGTSRSISLSTDYRGDVVQLDDKSTRWWFPLRPDYSYHPILIHKITQCERQYSIHGPSNTPLSKMLYDMMLYKILRSDNLSFESWRQEFEPLMLRYLQRHTIDEEAKWVDDIIEEGWTRTGGTFV